jgi:hypothetical protein
MRMLLNDEEAKQLVNSSPSNPFRRNFGADVSVKIKTQVVCSRTGEVIKDNPFRKNLTYDIGLNAMARAVTGTPTTLRCGPASIARVCRIGDSTSAVKIASGAITFTQAAFTVTASSGFFTAAMVGAILKYGAAGSGGVEYYITAFTSATVVTVDTSATVGATAGVVWMVQQSAMGNLLFTSSSYQTNAGDNQTTLVGNVATHQRTFTFPVQGAPYNVNEVGYTSQTGGVQVLGRIVLPSTDVVGTSNFYRVIILVTVTYTPSAPSAVGNLGVNWNTAGNAMMEFWSVAGIDSTGAVNGASPNNDFASLDACSEYSGFLGNTSGGMYLIARIGATYAQNASISTAMGLSWGTLNTNYLQVDSNLRQWTVTAARGAMKLSYTGNSSTTGQTCYGIGISPNFNSLNTNRDKPAFDILFTTPQALPNGSWLPTIEFTQTYSRTLVN